MGHPIDEGLLTANRIAELEESPVVGRFDTTHLCTIHSRIFQDLPHHHPGQFRRKTSTWVKARALESGEYYAVPYAPWTLLESRLAPVLKDVQGPLGFRGLSRDLFATRMAQFYADLDYLHPFSEGNSRTLRTFTRHVSREAGFDLDWSPSNADGTTRDQLYRARDLAVIHRAFPNLDEQRAMETDDRMEYETYWVLKKLQQATPLEVIIRQYTTLHEEHHNALPRAGRDEPEEHYEPESE
jgi:cell filamentation protein